MSKNRLICLATGYSQIKHAGACHLVFHTSSRSCVWSADEMCRSHRFLDFPQLCKKGLQVHKGCSSFLECRARHFRETALLSWLTGRYNADSVTVIPALSFAYKFLPDFETEEKQNLCRARQFYLGATGVLWAQNWIVFAISKHINFIFNLPLVLIFF